MTTQTAKNALLVTWIETAILVSLMGYVLWLVA